MKIMIINGSPRKESHTKKLTQFIRNYNYPSNVSVCFFDVSKHLLPIFQDEDEQYEHPEVLRLIKMAKTSNAFLICTPEYHNGMSGALKNALDYLSKEHFKGKLIQIFAAAGSRGGINALNQLRLVLRSLGAIVLPQQHIVDESCFDQDGKISKEKDRDTINNMVNEIIEINCRGL